VGGYPAPDRVQAGPRLKALLEDHFEELCLVVVCESGITLAEAPMRACPVFARKSCPVAEPAAASVRVCV